MYGLSSINVELTSRCNKSCWMCGRRKIEKERPELANWGDMPLGMVEEIASQVPPGIFVQLHNNGEPLLYPDLGEAIDFFATCGQFTGLDTNGKLLMEKATEIERLNSIAVSIIPKDPEAHDQYETVVSYLGHGDRPKIIVFRLLGDVDFYIEHPYRRLAQQHKALCVRRQLHSPDGSHDYEKPVTVPEIGVCLEMLHKLSIDRFGNVSPCVRFDPEGEHIIGNINKSTLGEIWNSPQRKEWLQCHLEGRRDKVPLCSKCHYWGVPRG